MMRRCGCRAASWVRAAVGVGLASFTTLLAGVSGVGAQETPASAQEGIYARPFIGAESSASFGGYAEANSKWFSDEGVEDGLSFEMRRFNLFFFASLSDRLRFISELEFEDGTEEITLETALVDFRISSALVLRAGVILPPIGFLNQNHDSPRWDWVERPLVTTAIIPSTLSEPGVGAYGRFDFSPTWALTWDAYLTNGLGAGVVGGSEEGRTDLAAGKSDEIFSEDNNGSPAVSGRLALIRPGRGEFGVSYYGGAYNDFRVEGEEVAPRRRVDLAALDLGLTLGRVELRGEAARAWIDIPPGMAELFGSRQWGGHLDIVVPFWTGELDGSEARLSAGLRVERVDFNDGSFSSTGRSIGDEVTVLSPGIAFRPRPGSVLRINYRYEWVEDFVGNDPAQVAGIQVGIATYF
ncbi:MAG: hypothetical protein RQ745_03860 [Longimicrobiales bacterium]|nr:hypothetical protein [Longimicrobiales bacterium]